MDGILFKILGAFLTAVLAFSVGMLFAGLRRKVTARVQNRVGPPVYQNFLDLLKLQSKRTNVAHGFMGHLAPVWIIIAAMTVLMFIPILHKGLWFENLTMQGDLIFLLYMMVFGSLGMALGAGQTGNPNSALGVSRGLSQMVGFEIPFMLALVALMLQFKTTSIADLMHYQEETSRWIILENPFAFVAALLASLGMFRYSPFDIVGAPAELASGPVSEFGGKYLGTMMTGGAVFAFIKLVMYVDLFLGGAGHTELEGIAGTAVGLLELLLKTFLLYMIPVFIGLVSPRFRTEQAIRFFWKWPTFFGIIAIVWALYKNGTIG
jgi:NADH-quinone oxidoreductase subunit H